MSIRDITYVGEGLIPAPNDGPALRYNPLRAEDVTDIAVHHMTGVGPAPDATTGQEIGFLQGIDKFHRTTRGLDGIGYHIVAMASGRVYIVSRLDKYGAHVGGENDHLPGLALPGDYSVNIPSPKHLEGCREAVRYIYEYLGREVPTTPHLNWGGTTCPGDRWREWVPQLTVQEDDMLTTEDKVWIAEKFEKLHDDVQKMHNVTRNMVSSSGASLSAAQVRKAVKDALKEGTG